MLVADRENSRIQRFTLDGEFIDEWLDVARPCDMFIDPAGRIFVTEIGFRAGKYYGVVPPNASGGRVSVFSPKGELLARFGGVRRSVCGGRFLVASRHLDRFAWRFLCWRGQLHDRHSAWKDRSRQPHAAKVYPRIDVKSLQEPLLTPCRLGSEKKSAMFSVR